MQKKQHNKKGMSARTCPRTKVRLPDHIIKKEQQMKSNLKFNLSQVSLAVLLAFTFNMQVANAEEEVLPEYTFMDAIKTGKNMTNFRLRYEHVEQDGL
jgi:hypothetical protein